MANALQSLNLVHSMVMDSTAIMSAVQLSRLKSELVTLLCDIISSKLTKLYTYNKEYDNN